VHGSEERTTEDTSNTSDVERVKEDVVFSLEDKHEVEGTGDTEWHTIGEGSLTDWVNEENSSSSGDWSGESNENPRTHTETVRELPFTTQPSGNTDKEVKDNNLVGTTVVKPFIKRVGVPDRVEVKTDSVGRRNNGTRDDVVTIEKGTGDRLTDAIDVSWWSYEESQDVGEDSNGKDREHDNAEETNVHSVRGGKDGRDCGSETVGVVVGKTIRDFQGKTS
jgi:hypothetical protein